MKRLIVGFAIAVAYFTSIQMAVKIAAAGEVASGFVTCMNVLSDSNLALGIYGNRDCSLVVANHSGRVFQTAKLADERLRNFMRTPLNDQGFVICGASSPRSDAQAVGIEGGEISIWNAVTNGFSHVGRHPPRVLCLGWSATGVLASGGLDGKVILWDLATKKNRSIEVTHEHGVRSIAFSPDGSLIASGGEDGKICVTSMSDEKSSVVLETPSHTPIDSLTFIGNSDMLASGDTSGNLVLWDTNSGKKLGRLGDSIFAVANLVPVAGNSGDPAFLLSSHNNGMVRLWDVRTKKEIDSVNLHCGMIRALAYDKRTNIIHVASVNVGLLALRFGEQELLQIDPMPPMQLHEDASIRRIQRNLFKTRVENR
ncbi:WD40 repeat domain-containing protein [Blastopirellula marina]|uniref:Tyrosine protein kinase:WD-40 repeat:Serine/threonine protein kinase n=1 Tax=Blastopirellula marina DSM 3645 TaxID=314230 RepID=A3ZVF3_9BACT|nr:serine/threonine protein kinase [Blastopirellula marina]EAQ79299.1 Tyrosine protein kinase:WD-40 repeat:Serine/threonine protein kinase [Blastopirellula marina DSM 3645]